MCLRELRRIRRHLSKSVATTVANAMISSRLDYCNSLFRSLSRRDSHKLQCLQNSAARIVTNTIRTPHITPALKSLHWLPVKYRSIFKTLTLVYKYLHTGLPKYFGPSLSTNTCPINTRRSNPDNLYLNQPPFKSKIHKSTVHFKNSFSFDGPSLWNHLPYSISSYSSLNIFRKRLKSYLFNKAYPP